MTAGNEWVRPVSDGIATVNEPVAFIQGKGFIGGQEKSGDESAQPSPRIVAKWRNLAGPESDQRFLLELTVAASSEREGILQETATFVLDTGSDITIVSPSLALVLGLRNRALVHVQRSDGTAEPMHAGEIKIMVGDQWVLLPCLIPNSPSSGEEMQNLLGMKGLLDKYVIQFDRSELCLLRR